MLSAHELATLLLIKDSPERIGVDRSELGALRALDLVEIESPEAARPVARITDRGAFMLRAIAAAR